MWWSVGMGDTDLGKDEELDIEVGWGGVVLLFFSSNERCQVWLSVAVQQRCSILHAIFLSDRFN